MRAGARESPSDDRADVAAAAPLRVRHLVLPWLGADATVAKLIAIACLALPILAVRMVPIILLNRDLRFERVAAIDIVSRIALYGFALSAAALGFGVYGLACAIPVSAVVSYLITSRIRGWSRGFSVDMRTMPGLARFGFQVSAYQLLTFGFEVVLIALLAAVGSPALAGFYALSRRVLGLPLKAVSVLQRVGFPAFARLEPGPARTRQMAKATVVSATAMGFALAVVVGSAEPLVSLAFGPRWLPAVNIMTISAVGLLMFTSLGGVIAGRALADGQARVPLIAVLLQIASSVALVFALVPRLGADGAGVAIAFGYVLFSGVLVVRSRGLRPVPPPPPWVEPRSFSRWRPPLVARFR